MPHRRLPKSNPARDKALSTCKEKMDAVPASEVPFSNAKGAQLSTDQPAYHALIAASNLARFNQTLQSGVVAPLRHAARLWVSHGFQAMINACIRGQFDKQVKNLYGVPVDSTKGPKLDSESDIEQAAVTYNDGETARVSAGGVPITFPALADINTHVDAFKAANLIQSSLKMAYDRSQEALADANTNIDLLILQLWNAIEATYDTGDKPSLRRKAREWGVVYVPSAGEAPSGDDFSVIGLVTELGTELPLEHVELLLSNATLSETYITTADGMYFMPPVPSGTYELRASLVGYLTHISTVTVVEGEVTEQNISMKADTPPPPPAP